MRSADDWKLEGAQSDAWGRGRQEKDALPTFTTSYMTLRFTAVSSNVNFLALLRGDYCTLTREGDVGFD
jgi:hypothetical protein